MVKLLSQFVMPILLTVLAAACGSAPVENKINPVPSPTPLPPPAERVTKPVNVSFSTYSKDWPVGWQWIDPDEKRDPTPHDVKTRVLRVRLTTKKNLNGEMNNAPRYLKPLTGDFQIETRVKFHPTEDFQGAGLLIYQDDGNFLSFERAYGGTGGGPSGIRLDAKRGGVFEPVIAPGEIQTDADEVEMKLVRGGNLFTAYWRENENAEWRDAGEFHTGYPDTVMAGLVACNTARETTVEFAYIRLSPPPKK